ncbi:MAG: hypothetical protein ACRD4D_00775 [Candidatus Acidiferrales bacterium]
MAQRAVGLILWLALSLWLTSCGVVPVKRTEKLPPEKVLPLQTATLDELVATLRRQQESVRTLNAEAELAPSTGSAYSGVIEEYHDVRAFILAVRRPESSAATSSNPGEPAEQVRMIGQAPVVRRTIFDMVADDESFRVLIPSKNKFIIGPNSARREAKSPIENLRPQHLFDAVFPQAPYSGTPVLLEENEVGGRRYYVISEIVLGEKGQFLLNRKWWFERSRLDVVRFQRFDDSGHLMADVHYSAWMESSDTPYPSQIELARPHEDYRLKLLIRELKLNEPIEADKFRLEQPGGTDLIDLAKDPLPQEPPSL